MDNAVIYIVFYYVSILPKYNFVILVRFLFLFIRFMLL